MSMKASTSMRNLKDALTCNDMTIDELSAIGDGERQYQSDDDDDESFFHTSSAGETSRNGKEGGDGLYSSDAKVVLALRVMILVILAVTGAVTAATMYLSSERYTAHLASEVAMEADYIVRSVESRFLHMLEVMDDMSSELSVRGGDDWPFVTFDDFESNGARKRAHAGLEAIILLPLVSAASLPSWRNYTTTKGDWRAESLQAQAIIGYDSTAQNGSFSSAVHDVSHSVVKTAGPFLPLWQMSPTLPDASIYDVDMLRFPELTEGLAAVLAIGEAVVGSLKDMSAIPSELFSIFETTMQHAGVDRHMAEPIGTLFYPIRSQDTANPSVVGILGATFLWGNLFKNTLSQGTGTFVAVIDQNISNSSLAYRVDAGQALFLGNDTIDASLNELESSTSWERITASTADPAITPLQEAQSRFIVRLYPADATDIAEPSRHRAVYASLVVIMFAFMTLLFLLYDYIVQRRQNKVHEAAVRSTKIVTSLFPNQIADRLFQTDDAHSNDVEQGTSEEYQVKENFMSHHERPGQGLINEPPKHKLKQVLKNNGQIYDDVVTNQSEKPIADFFPACTVMFADIAGFTAFASERPPEQVFQLLQAVYQAFDKAARKRHVFKVETIGDCYVAVTGLPEAQPDHAVILSSFALHCRTKMKEVTRKLERTLGPDTSTLVMRFGLHSGPVIAGVLRGERARFQLFGDTVNLAARMESTGQRDCIQVSESTANLLTEAGKGGWVSPRDELVSVKGKGQMKTFWLESRDAYSQRTKLLYQVSCDSFDGTQPDEASTRNVWEASPMVTGREAMKVAKQEIWGRSDVDMPQPTTLQRCSSDATCRLIDWNTQVLYSLLKPVVAHRLATKGYAVKADNVDLYALSSDDGNVLGEVREIIDLPVADFNKNIKRIDPESIALDGDIENQLRDYITGIASMYRLNSFHAYDHSCHVQCAMVKFLQRVVSPDSVDYHGANDSVASDVHSFTFGIASEPLISFAVVFSALIHDVDHCGVSNGQLVKEGAPVAAYYNGKSVAEQNSIDLAWELLMQPNFKELRGCIFADQSEFNRFRQLVVNIVLATDIFDKELSALRKARWNKAFSEESLSEPLHIQVNRKATIVLEHLIQASDVSHTMQHWEIYRKWNEKLFFEMYIAFKTGRVAEDPSTGWFRGEISFFDNYVIPLAKKLKECGVFGVSSDECLNYALENRRIWVDRGEDLVKEMLATDYLDKDAKKTRRSRRKRNKLDISLD